MASPSTSPSNGSSSQTGQGNGHGGVGSSTSSSTTFMSPSGPGPSLTSFGFLDESKGEQSDNGLGLGTLFNRVRSAFVAPAPISNNSPSPTTPTIPGLATPSSSSSSIHNSRSHSPSTTTSLNPIHRTAPTSIAANGNGNGIRLSSASPASPITSRLNNDLGDGDSGMMMREDRKANRIFSHQTTRERVGAERMARTISAGQKNDDNGSLSPSRSRNPMGDNNIDANNLSQFSRPTPSSKPKEKERSNAPLFQSIISKPTPSSPSQFKPRAPPMALRSLAPAPTSTLTFTASAHATAHRHLADDMSSIGGDDLDLLPDLHRAALEGQQAGNGAMIANWSSIPGFPLSGELLADDSRSIHSVSSYRRPRSDSVSNMNDDSSGNQIPSAARAGLQTSADAIYRKMKGEGMSRKFWMADESVRECRECLNAFGPFRRKHREFVLFCSRVPLR